MIKFLSVACIVISVILFGLSIYAGWSLHAMINDQVEHSSSLLGHIGPFTTVPMGPHERFLGNGWLGTIAPTAFAMVAMFCLYTGWTDFPSQKPAAD